MNPFRLFTMKYFSILITILIIISCKHESATEAAKLNDAALLHKNLYSTNRCIINELSKDLPLDSDSAYMRLSEYVDVVVKVLIEKSGGQHPHSGDLVNPKDTTIWLKTLQDINFRRNWEVGVKKLGERNNSHELLNSGVKRVRMAKEKRMKLDRLCLELRLLQLEILGREIRLPLIAYCPADPDKSQIPAPMASNHRFCSKANRPVRQFLKERDKNPLHSPGAGCPQSEIRHPGADVLLPQIPPCWISQSYWCGHLVCRFW